MTMVRASTLIVFLWTLVLPSFGAGTFNWPSPPVPPGANPTLVPVPQMNWFDKFQQNLDASKKVSQINLIFDGDSITDFWQGTGKQVWNQHYTNLGAFDFGISADRVQNLLWRLQNGQVDNLHPKLVVLLIGTNNISECTAQQIAKGVKGVVDEYRQRCPEATILLQGIFPRGQLPTDPLRSKIKEVNSVLAGYADGQNVIYVDFGDKFLQPDGSLSKDIMPDFLHPSQKGYEIWADAIQSQVDAIFSQK
jgi:lysophospholipase L1-like esterase